MSREDSRGESRFLVCLDRGPKYPGFHAEPRMELGPKLKELRTNRILTLGTVSFFVDPPLFVVFFALVVILQPPSDSAGLLVFIAAQRLAFLGVMMLLIVAGLLLVPVLITFYLTLRDVSRALLLTAVALGAVSIAFHFVGVAGSLSLVGLSDSYSAATSGTARAAYLASAAATQQFNQTASFIDNLSSSVASLLIGLIMLRSPIFSRRIGYLGGAVGIVGILSFVPGLDVLGLVVTVLTVIWFASVGLRLVRMRSPTSDTPHVPSP